FIKARGQTDFRLILVSVRFAEAVNDCAFQSRVQIRGRLGRFSVIPDVALFFARRAQHPLEVVLPRASLKVYELRDVEAAYSLTQLRADRLKQRKDLCQRPRRGI